LEIGQLVYEEIGTLNEIDDLRNQYLDGLLEAQELYLELLVRKAKIFVIKTADKRIGYFLLGDDATLLEYYVTPENINQVDTVLRAIIQELSVKTALCKSFDLTLLSCCVGIQKTVKAIGIHFREYREKPDHINPENITVRLAINGDERHIIEINEEIFEHDEEVREYIRKKQILIFEKEKEIIGFGIFTRVIEGRPEYDIGMLVDKKYRRRGYGEHIIRYLADYCKQREWRPICGCAIENEGSRRCLEKAGYIGRYRLLKFEF